jgi:hypothetical protein
MTTWLQELATLPHRATLLPFPLYMSVLTNLYPPVSILWNFLEYLSSLFWWAKWQFLKHFVSPMDAISTVCGI